jgi:hypothetical protein
VVAIIDMHRVELWCKFLKIFVELRQFLPMLRIRDYPFVALNAFLKLPVCDNNEHRVQGSNLLWAPANHTRFFDAYNTIAVFTFKLFHHPPALQILGYGESLVFPRSPRWGKRAWMYKAYPEVLF